MSIPMRIIVSCLLGLLILTTVQAQQSMLIGGVSVKLGMKKEEALAQYRSPRFEIIDLQNDTWMIAHARDGQAKIESIGILQFDEGRLFSAQRTWAQSEGSDAIKLIDLLFTALQTQTGNEPRLAHIHTQKMDQPGLFNKSIDISIDQRWFRISSTTGDNVVPSIQIYEEIRRQSKK